MKLKIFERWTKMRADIQQEKNREEYFHPVILPERGFVLLKGEYIPQKIKTEQHEDGIEEIISKNFGRDVIDRIPKEKRTLYTYEQILLERGAVVFINRTYVNLGEYQIAPKKILTSTGTLNIPNGVGGLDGNQASGLLKYMNDFKRMGTLAIYQVMIDPNTKEKRYQDMLLFELNQQLSDRVYYSMKQEQEIVRQERQLKL